MFKYTRVYTYIYLSLEFIPSWVSESCKSMTHFPPGTLVKQSQLRLFSLRHDFSANNTLAHVGYISLITHTPACTPWKFATVKTPAKSKNMSGEEGIARHDVSSFPFPPIAIRPGDFQFGPTTGGGKKCRPAHSIFSMHCHSPHDRAHYYASPKRVRAGDGRWKVFHENLRDPEYNRKYEGGSTERNTSPFPTPRPNLTPPSLFSQQWPT